MILLQGNASRFGYLQCREETRQAEYDLAGKRYHVGITLLLQPCERGTGNKFSVQWEGRPKFQKYPEADVVNAVREGVEASWSSGVYGNPVTDMEVILTDIKADDGDTNPMAMRKVTGQLLSKLLATTPAYLLEPIMKVEIVVPEKYLGVVLSDLTGVRRGW